MYFTGLLWAVGEHLMQPLYIEKPHDISYLRWQFTCPFNLHNKPKVNVGHFLHFGNMKIGVREIERFSLDDMHSQEQRCWSLDPGLSRLDRILSFQLGDSQPCRGNMKIVKFEKACSFFDFILWKKKHVISYHWLYLLYNLIQDVGLGRERMIYFYTKRAWFRK